MTVLDHERSTRTLPPEVLDQRSMFEAVATAVNSTLDLREVLRRIADHVLAFSGADRVSLFLLEDGVLEPAIALSADDEPELWSAFRTMPPVRLDHHQAQLFAAGGAVGVPDARTSPIIPAQWVSTFGLRGMGVVPLHAAGEPCGLLAVDWTVPRSTPDDELRTLETLASFAGLAVRNARLFEAERRRARLHQALAEGTATLALPLAPDEIAHRLARAVIELVGARVCGVALLDGARTELTSIACVGAPGPSRPVRVADVPRHLVEGLWEEWALDKRSLRSADPWWAEMFGCDPSHAAWCELVPLVVNGHTEGVLVLGFDESARLDRHELEATEGLAVMAAAALERHALLSDLARQVRCLDGLNRLSAASTETTDAANLIRRLNDLLAGHGLRVTSICFRDRQVARRYGGADPTPADRALWKRGDGTVALADGGAALPMLLGRRCAGTIALRPAPVTEEDRAFVEALARGLAEVTSRGALREAAEEAKRDRAVVAERDRLAADLHDTVGQLFVALGLMARRDVELLPPDSPWAERFLRLAELADQGSWEIEQTLRALAYVPTVRRGLVSSLRALARTIAANSGIEILVDTNGRVARLPGRLEQAFYRVANEALVNSWRHARCGVVRMELDFTSPVASLTITDDGVGLERRHPQGPHIGINGMRRAMHEVGGTLTVRSGRPRGVRVQATVPFQGRRR